MRDAASHCTRTQQSTCRGQRNPEFRVPPSLRNTLYLGALPASKPPPGGSGPRSRVRMEGTHGRRTSAATGAVGSAHPKVLPGQRKGKTKINVNHYHWAEIWLHFPARDAACPLLPVPGGQPGCPGRWGAPAPAFR